MIEKQVMPGPGTVRLGRFIGRLGVVSLPAIEVALDLDERVVRRHVARLEKVGWLVRGRWVQGEGSVVWLTAAGQAALGLGALRPVKSPPSSAGMHRGIHVSWSAARFERRGRRWMSIRELSADRDRWAVRARCDRGFTRQLPDFAVWVEAHELPCAVVVESGRRRDDRQKMILEGWRDAIHNGRYAHVQYDCTSPSLARWIKQLAKTVRLSESTFSAIVQPGAEQITALPPAATEYEPPPPAARPADADQLHGQETKITVTRTPLPQAPVAAARPGPPPLPPEPAPETAEATAARKELIRELLHGPAKPQRRWRRS